MDSWTLNNSLLIANNFFVVLLCSSLRWSFGNLIVLQDRQHAIRVLYFSPVRFRPGFCGRVDRRELLTELFQAAEAPVIKRGKRFSSRGRECNFWFPTEFRQHQSRMLRLCLSFSVSLTAVMWKIGSDNGRSKCMMCPKSIWQIVRLFRQLIRRCDPP